MQQSNYPHQAPNFNSINNNNRAVFDQKQFQEQCPHINTKVAQSHTEKNKDRTFKSCLDCKKFLGWVGPAAFSDPMVINYTDPSLQRAFPNTSLYLQNQPQQQTSSPLTYHLADHVNYYSHIIERMDQLSKKIDHITDIIEISKTQQ